MGTFHDTKDPLHGITVVARRGRSVYVGRCHERDEQTVLLRGVDIHEEDATGLGPDGRSNEEFLERAARLGIWSTYEQLALPAAEVQSLIPLNQFFKSQASGESPPPAPAAEAAVKQAMAPVQIEADGPAQATDVRPVQLTDSASQEVRRLLQEEGKTDLGLRLGVAGGGCSGFVYQLEFDSRKDGDLVMPCEGFDVYLDRKSTIYLRGVTLDYQKGLGGRGFQFQNPNASNTCGCGESFSV